VGTRCANHVTPLYPQKLALTSPTGGGRSVGMVRSRTKSHGESDGGGVVLVLLVAVVVVVVVVVILVVVLEMVM